MSGTTNGKRPVKNRVQRLVRPPQGGAGIIPGNPGNSGGKKRRSGRKPNVYRELCEGMLSSPDAQRSVARILKDDRHPHFASIYKHLAEYAHGKPVQPISGEDGGDVVVRVIREEISLARD
ncbi:MAG TPA: hypothetical protein VGP44_05665 [Gemmatimonadales bacterium]|nr:hypothetical protein [Gemmatimonadales bacterium]